MLLENDVLRIELDKQTGGFRSIHDKKLGQEWIAAPDRASLFRLIAPEGVRECLHVESEGASIEVEGQRATLTYRSGDIEAEAMLELDGRGLLATLRVKNGSNRNIEEILFPCVRGLAPVEDNAFIWPWLFGTKREDLFNPKSVPFSLAHMGGDHHTWNEWTQKADARYPEHLASAWCDYGNAQCGIGLEGRHKDFSILDFFAHKVAEKDHAPQEDDPVRRTLDLMISQPRRVMPGETWETHPVRLFVHEGDWHVTADAHREWLETWVKKPDRPKKFAEAIGWHFYFMKHQDDLVLHTYDDLPGMAEAALEAGCEYLLLFGWQVGGHDNNYMYRYVPNEEWGGAENLKKNLEKIREMGVEAMPFYNGTLANTEMPEHKEFGHKWEAKTRTGHPYYAGDWARHNFDATTRNRAMLHYEIAPCKEHREYFVDTIRRMVEEYGFRTTQLDQIAEKMFVDYNEDHIKTTPDRVYVDGLGDILPRVREIIQKANPDGVMISEGLNDFTGQWCDSSWDWNLLITFPEPILYTLPWLMGSHETDALEYGDVNRAFAHKLHLDMKIDGGDAPISKYPKFAAHVKKNATLRKAAADYYVYGDYRDQENVAVETQEGVIVKTYLNRSANKLGVVVAEYGGTEASVHIKCDQKAKAAKSLSNNGAEDTLSPAPEYDVKLQPYEVRVLCLDLA